MDVINMVKTNSLTIKDVSALFPEFSFAEHEVFHWSPSKNCVFYNPELLKQPQGMYQLLHEISHALLGHTHFGSGVELLRMETDAWEKAKQLATENNIAIDNQHIERCLDSYRDWLHMRSTCPNCQNIAAEVENNTYHCFNCFQKWTVPKNQRSRYYRLKSASKTT